MMSSSASAIPTPFSDSLTRSPVARGRTNRKNMLLLIQLRWLAVVGQIVAIAVAQWGLGLRLPLLPMLALLLALIGLNLFSIRWVKQRGSISDKALIVAMLLDVCGLTAQLYLSGGTTNPFAGLYLLQSTLAAILLRPSWAWRMLAFIGISLIFLSVYNLPLALDQVTVLDAASLQLLGNLVCFALDAGLLVFYVIRITSNLRQRDEHLAELKQREAEEDHIVRMGLLASGAAHELGTPLASVAVILGDWRRMPTMADQTELMADIQDMQAAIQRCKSIVTGILSAAGEARSEAIVATTIHEFIHQTATQWRAARPAGKLEVINGFGTDVAIVSDSSLQQVIANLLDNAADVSPNWIQLHVRREEDELVLEVADAGNGFTPEMLAQFGRPYRSTKGKLGGGLGLFLVVNVVRKLGGSVAARNAPDSGARVMVRLPLESLRYEAEHER